MLIMWYSKRQNTVETTTIGSELMDAKIATEMMQGVQNRHRMMSMPIVGRINKFCDNQSVIRNSTLPDSSLKKKHVAICFHCVRQTCVSGMIQIAKEDGVTDLADLLTKSLPGQRLWNFIGWMLN